MALASGFSVRKGSQKIGRECAEGQGPFYDVTFVLVSQILTLKHTQVVAALFSERGQCFENAVASILNDI
jgi:hypothetical protein